MPTATIRRDTLRIGDGNNPKQLILGQEEGDTSPAHQGKKKQKINNMRKKKFIYAALALVTLGLTACQQEEDFTPQGGEKELRIATRSTAAEGTTEAFTRDFNLDLWSNDNPNKYERHAMWKSPVCVTPEAQCR